MKKLFTLIVVCLTTVSTWARYIEAEVDGIYYVIDDFGASVAQGYGYDGSVIIPEKIVVDGKTYTVNGIAAEAFGGCSDLTSVTIPNSVRSIEERAFSYCEGLTSVTIPNSVWNIGENAFEGCSGLTSVTIPNSVISIGDAAFYDCSGLTSVTIPNSVWNIGESAFSGCYRIKTISIGTGIETIGSNAFESCSNVETVTCYAEDVPKMGTNVFGGVENATLYVPEASIKLYKKVHEWTYYFSEILPIEDTGINDVMLTTSDGQIYNISGRKAKNSDKGILIRNGKKYINK